MCRWFDGACTESVIVPALSLTLLRAQRTSSSLMIHDSRLMAISVGNVLEIDS